MSPLFLHKSYFLDAGCRGAGADPHGQHTGAGQPVYISQVGGDGGVDSTGWPVKHGPVLWCLVKSDLSSVYVQSSVH